jgi:hypothetical protein
MAMPGDRGAVEFWKEPTKDGESTNSHLKNQAIVRAKAMQNVTSSLEVEEYNAGDWRVLGASVKRRNTSHLHGYIVQNRKVLAFREIQIGHNASPLDGERQVTSLLKSAITSTETKPSKILFRKGDLAFALDGEFAAISLPDGTWEGHVILVPKSQRTVGGFPWVFIEAVALEQGVSIGQHLTEANSSSPKRFTIQRRNGVTEVMWWKDPDEKTRPVYKGTITNNGKRYRLTVVDDSRNPRREEDLEGRIRSIIKHLQVR